MIKNRQSGATLITALIMLIVLTLLVVSGIRSSNINLRIAGNMQMQEEAVSAAQQGIEQILSVNFTVAPAAATIPVDINNDGTTDYTAQVAMPACTSSAPLDNAALNLADPADQVCFTGGSDPGGGILIENASGVATASSRPGCDIQTWNIRAQTTDGNTGANTTLHQGVFLRVVRGTACL